MSISEEFPLLKDFCYLNTAGEGLIPRSVIESTCELYRRCLTSPPVPDVFDEFGESIEKWRGDFAAWINARPEEVSFQSNASTGINLAISMVSPERGDNVIVDDLGFPSGTFPVMALAKKGVEVRWVKNRDGLITAKDYEPLLDSRTRLVIVNLVSWINGLRAEVEQITKLAHEKGALCIVDSTHGTGYIDLDVSKSDIDFLTTSNYKWLLSTFGAAEFFCSRRLLEKFEPPHLGWHSVPKGVHGLSAESMELAKTARRLEPGNPDYISIFTLMGSLQFMSRFGRERITQQTLKLSAIVNEGLKKLGLDVLSPNDKEHLSAITRACAKNIPGDQLVSQLRKRKIVVAPRSYHERSGIRVGPYFYNDERDIERFLSAVKEITTAA